MNSASLDCSIYHDRMNKVSKESAYMHSHKNNTIFRCFKFTLKPPYSIAHDKLRLAIWDTSFWTFWLKFGHKGP